MRSSCLIPDWSHAQGEVRRSSWSEAEEEERKANVGDEVLQVQEAPRRGPGLLGDVPWLLRVRRQEGKSRYFWQRMRPGKKTFEVAICIYKFSWLSCNLCSVLSTEPVFCFRSRRVSTVVTCCAATGATPPGGRGGRRGAGASSTGAATWSARSASGTCRSPPATNQAPTPSSFNLILLVIHSWTNHQHLSVLSGESPLLSWSHYFVSAQTCGLRTTFQVYCKYFITLSTQSVQWAGRPKSSVERNIISTDFNDLNVCYYILCVWANSMSYYDYQ